MGKNNTVQNKKNNDIDFQKWRSHFLKYDETAKKETEKKTKRKRETEQQPSEITSDTLETNYYVFDVWLNNLKQIVDIEPKLKKEKKTLYDDEEFNHVIDILNKYKDSYNNNALHVAVLKSDFNGVGLIIQYCDETLITQFNKFGKKPIDIATKHHIIALINSLSDLKYFKPKYVEHQCENDDSLPSTQEMDQSDSETKQIENKVAKTEPACDDEEITSLSP